MPRVEVVYASRHGGTAGIAQRIAEVLRSAGADVLVADAARRPDSAGFDAYVVGSGVYMGNWLEDGIDWLDHHRSTLATRPVWLFSSGPLPGSTKETSGADPLTNALGPVEGPGSGGRRKIEELSRSIRPQGHGVFQGAFDPSDPPKAISERLVRMMPAAKGLLPPGDFREWDKVEAWAGSLAGQILAPAPVA